MSEAREPLALVGEEQIIGPLDVTISIRYFGPVSKVARLQKIVPGSEVYEFLDAYFKLQRKHRK